MLQEIINLFSKPKAPKSTTAKSAQRKRKSKKKVSLEKELQTLEELKQNIKTNGYHSIQLKSLLRLFNCQNKSLANVEKVISRLQSENLFLCKWDVLEKKPKDSVRIYKFPVQRLGHLFQNEKELEDGFADYHWYKQLVLEINLSSDVPGFKPDRQFSPDGTKDKLDFRAVDAEGYHVVLELKNKGGDKRLIEQVLRYRTDLMHHFKSDKVRCIIITGERCLHTAKAFLSLPESDKKLITWYVYKWDRTMKNEISFEEVTLDFISRHLTTETTLPPETFAV